MKSDSSPATQCSHWFARNAAWFLPILAMALITPWTAKWDLAISNKFYKGVGAHEAFGSTPLFTFMFKYGTWFAFAIGGIATMIFITSYFKEKLLKWRKPTLVMMLTLFIGAGVLVNLVFKEHWGRPRPRQVIEFGGTLPFRPYYEPHLQFRMTEERMRSFPSGHSSMGFYFLCVSLVGYRLRNNTLLVTGIAFTIILGGLLGMARIMQGGHFFSDVVMSALIMWLTALFADWLVYHKLSKSL
jgi:lipid A 4'-phosphatase